MRLLLCCLLLSIPHFAATQPPVTIDQKPVDRNISWWSIHADSLFKSEQNIEAIHISKGYHFDLTGESDTLLGTSVFAWNNQAIAAINGGFFDTRQGGSVTYMRDEGRVVANTRQRLIDQKNEILEGMILIDRKGRLHIRSTDHLARLRARKRYPDILVTGPLLFLGGKEQPLTDRPFTNDRHPRSCLCKTRKGDVLFIAVDGRHDEARGLSLTELTKLARRLDCKDAINLDGGGSTSLFLRTAGVINHPSDNQTFDHRGERPCANVILVLEKRN